MHSYPDSCYPAAGGHAANLPADHFIVSQALSANQTRTRCVINRHYMSRDHGKNKAKLNFEAQSLHQIAPFNSGRISGQKKLLRAARHS